MLSADMWHLVVDELVNGEDGASLSAAARTSRILANTALPRLYRICRKLVDVRDVTNMLDAARLWRSIILSAEGKTAFPYCLWLETLSLLDLNMVLDGVFGDLDDKLRSLFFSGDMEPYNSSSRSPTACQKAVNAKAVETITRFIKRAAEDGHRPIYVSGLRVPDELLDMAPVWVARLPTLQQLQIFDARSLGAELAQAIRDHCPRFCRLAILVDDLPETEVLSFLRAALHPGRLEAFSAIGDVHFSSEALGALSAAHATSLKRLELKVSPDMLVHLGALRPCVSIERLDLYGIKVPWKEDDFCEGAERPCQWNREDPYVDADDLSDSIPMPSWMHEASFAHTADWLGACASLTSLTVAGISNCGPLLRIALRSPSLRLRYLHVFAPEPMFYLGYGPPPDETDACLLESLHHQTALEGFTFGWRSKGEFGWRKIDSYGLDKPGSPEHTLLMRALCQCPRLRELILMSTVLRPADLDRLAAALPDLETLSFDSDTYYEDPKDDTLDALWGMRKLKRVCCDAVASLFTRDGLMDFIWAVSVARPLTSITIGYLETPAYHYRRQICEYAQSRGIDLEISEWQDPP